MKCRAGGTGFQRGDAAAGRVAARTVSWTVTSAPSGVVAGRGRASQTLITHEPPSSPGDLVRRVEHLGHWRAGDAGSQVRGMVADHEQHPASADRIGQRGK